MNCDGFLLLIDEMLEFEPGTLKGSEKLADLENWDSLSIVTFMGLALQRFDKKLSSKEIDHCESVDDLFTLVGRPADDESSGG